MVSDFLPALAQLNFQLFDVVHVGNVAGLPVIQQTLQCGRSHQIISKTRESGAQSLGGELDPGSFDQFLYGVLGIANGEQAISRALILGIPPYDLQRLPGQAQLEIQPVLRITQRRRATVQITVADQDFQRFGWPAAGQQQELQRVRCR